jgi:MraZ protein
MSAHSGFLLYNQDHIFFSQKPSTKNQAKNPSFVEHSGEKCCFVGICGIFILTTRIFAALLKVSGGGVLVASLEEVNAVFRGINGVNIDAKGRIVMPTRYRERLQLDSNSAVVLTIDTEERCLLLYPLPEWEEIEKKLAALPSFNPAARRIQRLLIGHATDVEMDGHGRILLPPLLREYAGLSKQAVLVGQGKKFELWDQAHWDKSRGRWLEEESNSNGSALPDEVKSISL